MIIKRHTLQYLASRSLRRVVLLFQWAIELINTKDEDEVLPYYSAPAADCRRRSINVSGLCILVVLLNSVSTE